MRHNVCDIMYVRIFHSPKSVMINRAAFQCGSCKGSVAMLAVWLQVSLFYAVVAWQLGGEFLL